MPNAVLVGHSYVRRLAELLNEEPGLKNGPQELTWKFIGIGGPTIDPDQPDHRNIFHYLPKIAELQPWVIYVHLGENDLRTMSPAKMIENFRVLIERLTIACRPKKIVVSHLFPFPANQELRETVDHINQHLDLSCKTGFPDLLPTRVYTWYHTVGARSESQSFVYQDGVHLRRETMEKYCHSVGTAVSRQYNAVRRELQQ